MTHIALVIVVHVAESVVAVAVAVVAPVAVFESVEFAVVVVVDGGHQYALAHCFGIPFVVVVVVVVVVIVLKAKFERNQSQGLQSQHHLHNLQHIVQDSTVIVADY